jgi:hypothetical protein
MIKEISEEVRKHLRKEHISNYEKIIKHLNSSKRLSSFKPLDEAIVVYVLE